MSSARRCTLLYLVFMAFRLVFRNLIIRAIPDSLSRSRPPSPSPEGGKLACRGCTGLPSTASPVLLRTSAQMGGTFFSLPSGGVQSPPLFARRRVSPSRNRKFCSAPLRISLQALSLAQLLVLRTDRETLAKLLDYERNVGGEEDRTSTTGRRQAKVRETTVW